MRVSIKESKKKRVVRVHRDCRAAVASTTPQPFVSLIALSIVVTVEGSAADVTRLAGRCLIGSGSAKTHSSEGR
jgi:hypothetical protein